MEENKEFTFDLQLFAEGEEGYSEPSVEDNSGLEQPVEDSSADDFDWKVDDEGNVTFNPAMFDDDSEYVPEDHYEEQPTQEPVAEPTPETYTVKVNGVEQQVTLDDLRNGYMMHSDYTQKSQALAEERRQLEAMRNQWATQQVQPQQNVPQQTQPEPEPFDPKAYYKQLSDYAVKEVAQELGEEFDEYDPVHQAALADKISTIKARAYERNVSQQRMQSVYNKYAQDPNIREIDRYAAQRLNELPYSQAKQIYQAMENRNADLIDAYMDAVRDEYYRSRGYVPVGEQQRQSAPVVKGPAKTIPKQKPPFAESTGVAKGEPKVGRQIDYGKLGKLTLDQQAKLASQLGLG